MASHLLDLPDELIQTILRYVSPLDTALNISLASRRLFKDANEQLLWRHYCNTDFSYWIDESIFDHRASSQQLWKQRYINRYLRDATNMRSFESLLTTQKERMTRMQDIAESGVEAREMLLGYYNCDHNADDVLARRYWGESTMNLIHRSRALKTWARLETSSVASLEENLAAFDLFIIGMGKGDADTISAALDNIVHDIRHEHPAFDDLGLQEKLTTVAGFLRDNGLVGNSNTERYHGIENNFLSYALFSESHTSLPLQSTAIFVSVARRLGVNAHFCNFPTHIYAMAPLDQTHSNPAYMAMEDGRAVEAVIYLDPWAQSGVVDLDHLHNQLFQMGIPRISHHQYLQRAPVRDMVLRTARNVMRSWEETRRGVIAPHDSIDTEHAFYAFLWAMLLVGTAEQREMNIHRRRSYLPYLLETFQNNYPEDVTMAEKFIAPMLEGDAQKEQFFQLTAELRANDRNARPIMTRDNEATKVVKYKVGQVFQHKRYGYVGVIVGWDPKCAAGERWIVQMNVDTLPNGRTQSFYHIL